MANLDPQAQKELADLAIALANNPKTRKAFAGMVKEVNPTKRFADVEAEELEDRVNKRFEQRDQANEQERVRIRLEAQRDSLRSRYDDSAIAEIEKVMEKYGISDYEAGAKLYAADLKPAAPTYETSDHRWSMPNIEAKDFGNLKQISRQKAYQTIEEITRNRKKA